jgi:hypothetical protein
MRRPSKRIPNLGPPSIGQDVRDLPDGLELTTDLVGNRLYDYLLGLWYLAMLEVNRTIPVQLYRTAYPAVVRG